MTSQRHSAVIQSLHWAIATGIICSYISGLVIEVFSRGMPRITVTTLHLSLGLLGVTLTLLLAMWRLSRPGLAPIASTALLERLARVAHFGLYAGMVAVPLLGLAMMWAKGRDVAVFGLITLPSPIATDRALGRQFEELHELAAHGLLALAALHATAAVFHQLVLHDHGLERILPRSGPFRFPRA